MIRSLPGRVRWFSILLLLGVGCLFAVPLKTALANEATAKADKSGAGKSDATKAQRENDEEYLELMRLFADAFDQIERNYVKEVSRRELMEAAVRGVLLKLDPYSAYISPEELDRFRTGVESQFGGIGIQVKREDEFVTVISPFVGSPAYRAGITAGDRIMKIEGKSAKGISINEAVRQLKGKVGTSVTFTVQHPHDDSTETVTLKREIVKVRTVLGMRRNEDDSWDYMLSPEKGIGYIRVTQFSRNTVKELKETLDKLESLDVKGLILDLRNNPGGLLSSAIEVSDLFVSEGRIVSTEGRNTARPPWNARKAGTYERFAMVVLVNHRSASASEIVAACLQDHDRAVVVGQRTWGKGSVQNIIELEEGRSALKLTTAGYQRPSGANIHRFPDSTEDDEWGVTPNKGYEVRLTDDQAKELAEFHETVFHIRPKRTGDGGGENATVKPLIDRQLEKALEGLDVQLAKQDGKSDDGEKPDDQADRQADQRSPDPGKAPEPA